MGRWIAHIDKRSLVVRLVRWTKLPQWDTDLGSKALVFLVAKQTTEKHYGISSSDENFHHWWLNRGTKGAFLSSTCPRLQKCINFIIRWFFLSKKKYIPLQIPSGRKSYDSINRLSNSVPGFQYGHWHSSNHGYVVDYSKMVAKKCWWLNSH